MNVRIDEFSFGMLFFESSECFEVFDCGTATVVTYTVEEGKSIAFCLFVFFKEEESVFKLFEFYGKFFRRSFIKFFNSFLVSHFYLTS